MTTSPFFSIIIPTYNRAGFIKTTIESVLNQQFEDFEIIVVDDGSTDETEAIVKSIPCEKLRYYKKQNGERGAARNTGVVLSHGVYVTFLDSDDILYANHLAVAHLFLVAKLPDMYHQAYEVCSSDGRKKNYTSDFDENIITTLFKKGNILSCMGVFLKRGVAVSFPFNEDRELAGVEDWELWIRLGARYTIHYDKTITSVLRDHEQRSVEKANKTELVRKMNLLLTYIYADDEVNIKYTEFKRVLKANIFTYMSLHLSKNPIDKIASVNFLLAGFMRSPRIILRRRILAILRNLIFSW
jgi:glycosyltransferase involved in cell wall biosynthesis